MFSPNDDQSMKRNTRRRHRSRAFRIQNIRRKGAKLPPDKAGSLTAANTETMLYIKVN